MTRRGKVLLFLPTLLLLLLSLAMAWLLRSESGAGFAWRQAGSLLDGELEAGSLSGNLSSGLELKQFSYRDEGVQVTAGRISLSFDLDLFPPALNLARLDSSAVEVQLLDTGSQPEQSRTEVLSGLRLPYPVRFSEVTVAGLRVLDSSGAELFTASDILARGVWHQRLEIAEARLNSLDTGWQLAGELQLQPPFETSATVTAGTVMQLDDGTRMPLQVQADFTGNLERLEARLQSLQPGFMVEGELRDLLTVPGWNLEGSAARLDWPPVSPGTAGTPGSGALLTLSQLNLSSQGTANAYDVQLAAQLGSEELPSGNLELLGAGDSSGLQLEHFRFAGDELQLSATGGLDWQQQIVLSAHIVIESLQPQRWLPDWPVDHPLHGELQLQLSADQLAFSELALLVDGTATRLQGSGNYHVDSGEISANVNWQSLAWPLGEEIPEWTSVEGQLQAEGSLDAWRAQGELQLQAGDLPEGRLQLDAAGNEEGVQLRIPRGQVLGGTFSGQADYRWTEPQRWSADITAERISIGPLASDFPGILSGRVLAQGQAEDLQFELQDVRGRIRDLDVTAQGKFSLLDSVLQAEGLQLRSGSARLDLDGGMGPGQSLRFAARAEDLSQLWPELAGQLQASGELSLDAAAPRLDIDLNADELHWGEYHISRIRTGAQPDGSTTIMVTDANLGGRELSELQLQLDSSHRLQSVNLDAILDGTEIEAALAGRLQSANGQRINGWQGAMENLRISQPDRGLLQLEQPAPLLLSTQRMELRDGCLRGSRDGRICLQANWSAQGEAGLQAELQEISLDIVQLFADLDWAFTHRLSGSLGWHRPAQQPASAQAHFNLSSGELLLEDESTNFSTGPGTFAFQVSGGNLHSGRLNIPIIGSGEIDMDFGINRLLDGDAAELQANLKLQLRDLTPLQLLPYVDVAQGELSADLRISGNPQDPHFTGHAVLVRGRLENQAAGLVLSDIQLAGAVFQYDHTELNGSFRAGEGRGRIKADLRFGDFLHPEFSMQLSGENLLLVDVPDMNLLADPNLDIRWAGGKLQMNGKIRVPQARLSPRYLPATTASESPDLVIVSAEQDAPAATASTASALRINGQAEVELGPKVTITLDRATASIRGKSMFTWNDSLVPMGDGAFSVTGEIYAYGQLLNISEGRISFPNVPADNPYLNIKAEREIFGNTQIKRAGVLVSGTLKRPSLDPYTDPMSNRERALALLLTGSDFDYEQGVGAVEVGMYIAPKLFISYGIGLFEDQNVISARYDLGKGFGVKATSGQRETGVDISYTVEN
jgi:translocation and assembly module TamB